MEREFLKKDLEEGVITREEYRKELARLREKYADL